MLKPYECEKYDGTRSDEKNIHFLPGDNLPLNT